MPARARTPRPETAVAVELWIRYRQRGDLEARSELLERNLGLVLHAAHEMAGRLGRELEFDELVSAGTLGLIQALDGYEPSRGLAFSTHALPRIRGAMLDELRSLDWVPRSIRRRTRQIEHARARLRQHLGRAPEDEQVAEALGVPLGTYWRWLAEAGAPQALPSGEDDDAEPRGWESIPAPESEEPGETLSREQALAALRETFAALPAKDRTVLSLYYYEGMNLRQIGEVLRLSESRVSQIRTRALGRLRDRLSSLWEDA